MRAVVIRDGKVTVDEVPRPEPQGSQVLVRVHSAGLNGADLLQVRGGYPPPQGYRADIPGLELAGTVEETGPLARRFAIGDHVMGITGGEAQAEYAVVEDSSLVRVPANLPLTSAGGFPETFFTAYDALFRQANLALGEHLCVHGGAGGVGISAIQLGVAAGARVTASVRRPELRAPVEHLGALAVAPDEFSSRGPFDVILELVGAPNLEANLKSLAIGGRITVIGIGAGGKAPIDLRVLMSKRGAIFASTLRARSTSEKGELAREIERHVLPLVEADRLSVMVHERFALEDAASAYHSFASGGKLGKILLIPNHGG
jgi:NADPH:quinone reductase-like Zn-dependent oxidoreductase